MPPGGPYRLVWRRRGTCWNGYLERRGADDMPATSERQQKFMRAELGRKQAGKKTKTGMSEAQLEEYAKGMVKEPKKPALGRQAGPKKPPMPRAPGY